MCARTLKRRSQAKDTTDLRRGGLSVFQVKGVWLSGQWNAVQEKLILIRWEWSQVQGGGSLGDYIPGRGGGAS